jgi:hypothetical protein
MESCDLNTGENTTDNQGRRYKILLVGDIQINAPLAGENQGRSNDACQHGQRVLKTQEHRQKNRHLVIEAKEWSGPGFSTQKRDAWHEEKGVVVVTDEAVLGKERLSNDVQAIGHCFLGAHIWPNPVVLGHTACRLPVFGD